MTFLLGLVSGLGDAISGLIGLLGDIPKWIATAIDNIGSMMKTFTNIVGLVGSLFPGLPDAVLGVFITGAMAIIAVIIILFIRGFF